MGDIVESQRLDFDDSVNRYRWSIRLRSGEEIVVFGDEDSPDRYSASDCTRDRYINNHSETYRP